MYASLPTIQPEPAWWLRMAEDAVPCVSFSPGSWRHYVFGNRELLTGKEVGEDRVKCCHVKHPAPSVCPDDRLFVPASLCSQVHQWGHSSRLACPPGVLVLL